MRLRPICVSALVLAAALGAGCDVHVGENGVSLDVAGGKARDEWTRTYALAKGGSLEIVNTNGPIVVNAATGTQVEVVAIRQARAASEEEAQALLKETSITEDVSPTRVAVQTSSGNGILRGRRSMTVEYQVKVPAGVQVTVKTENGGISLHDVDGNLTASTTNGGIRGTNLSGALSARIVNGGIVVGVARVAGPIQLEAVNGGIRLDMPATVSADFDVHAVNGGVSADDGFPIAVSERSRTRIAGKLNGGGTPISVGTVNGGVRIGVFKPGLSAEKAEKEAADEAGPVLVERH
jgi:hypothetical protein